MRIRHFLLALLLVIVWGFGYVVIKTGLLSLPPLTFCAIRFFLVCFPAIFFVKRPAIPFYMVILYGCVMFVLQFSFLFIGMHAGASAGITALLVQTHVFFTIFLAIIFLHEKPCKWQILAVVIALAGIIIVLCNLGVAIPLVAFIFIIAAAMSWGVGNLICKKIQPVNSLSLVVWSSLIASPILLLMAIIFEGGHKIIIGMNHLSLLTWGTIIYIVYPVTLFGWVAWSWLLSKYPASTIAPFSLLTPIVAMLASVFVLGEPLPMWKIVASLLVITGLGINLLAVKLNNRHHHFVWNHLL